MNVKTTRECVVTDFPGQYKRFAFGPQRLLLEHRDGTVFRAGRNAGCALGID